MSTINAAQNPDLANRLVEKALSEDTAVEEKSPLLPPPPTEVKLPGGLADPFLGIIDTAEIRELNGGDEEAIARTPDIGKALLVILDRALVKVGGEPADKDIRNALLAGDREMILLAIRKITFGSEIVLGPGACPSCETEQTFTVDLDDDIKIKYLNQEDRRFTLDCEIGKVDVSLPTGGVQTAIVNSTNKNSAELDSILLKECINTINGAPVTGLDQVRNLSIKDRRKILQEISTRNPGPQLGEVSKPCKSCGSEVPLPLTLAELF